MASPSSATSRKYRFDVFPSFHGPDVREGFLSHLRKECKLQGIKMFNDQGIEKSQMIASSLTRAIRESRISIVILSKKYASSSWCLYELVEILDCKKVLGQIVVTIYYGVDPLDVRNQTGDFGTAFNETCAGKTDEERRKWTKSLTHVSNIHGEHLLKWDNESNMIVKIVRNVSYKLKAALSRDFEDMVGIKAHWRYSVFPSFHGPDVGKTFLSHLRKQFSCNGISMFDDQGTERSQITAPALTQAISESRISIVVLSKNYASSSWCLDELVGILNCKEDTNQIVMTVFYDVDPSDVRKQSGDFGRAFNETCACKTEEERRRWSQALNDVGNIAGEVWLRWDNESEMIEKIARDILDKLSIADSRDFEGIVGIEAHLEKMQSLLHLDYEDEAMIVGICGPAGIGKTTIARALYSRLSSSFPLTCFMENLRGRYNRGLDEIGLKLFLQNQLLSKLLDHNGLRICRLDAVKEMLYDRKVLIILDDVDDLKQLEALAKETNWFGPGSRIIVTTEDNEILEKHGINNTYHVPFPTGEDARKIVCTYAFGKNYPPDGFRELAERVTEFCSNLPLGLRVMGSSLRGKKQDEWEHILRRLEVVLDRDIEEVLMVGYDSLHENDQSLFLYIAVFFNYQDYDHVITMLANTIFDVRLGLKTLAYKSLIQISTQGKIVMLKLLQQMGRQIICKQESRKRQILIDSDEILDVLEYESGHRAVSGISFDISGISFDISISKKAFKRMPNLHFLRVYNRQNNENDVMHIPEDMELPRRLRLLQWEAYPRKFLPAKFQPGNLIELDMQHSELRMLWQGIQPLTNLRNMDLSYSQELTELPDLSSATNLEILQLSGCESMVELPTSIENLRSLKDLSMQFCKKLEVVPPHINLTSLEKLDMTGCSRLKSFPEISTNIGELFLSGTAIEEVPESVSMWSRLWYVNLSCSEKLKTVSRLPTSLRRLDLSYTHIKEMADCIEGLHGLEELNLYGCKKLESLPELPGSLTLLTADDCESLERVSGPLNTPNAQLNFTNCFKLSAEARRLIIQRSFLDGIACLPGRVIPSEFNHRASGNTLTISSFSASSRFRACVIIMPDQHHRKREDIYLGLRYRIIGRSGDAIYKHPVSLIHPGESPEIQTEHLFIFHCDFPEKELFVEVGMDILFELSNSACSPLDDCEIIECGIRILTNESERSCDGSKKFGLDQACEDYDDWNYVFEPHKALEDSEDEDDNSYDSHPSEVSEDSDPSENATCMNIL